MADERRHFSRSIYDGLSLDARPATLLAVSLAVPLAVPLAFPRRAALAASGRSGRPVSKKRNFPNGRWRSERNATAIAGYEHPDSRSDEPKRSPVARLGASGSRPRPKFARSGRKAARIAEQSPLDRALATLDAN